MALPTNRADFRKLCKRNLGWPLLEINVSEEQIDDKIDYALQYYADYHFDGSEKVYIKHQITQTDIDNGYLTIDENIIGITGVFPLSNVMSSGMFSSAYQLAFDAFTNLQSMNITGYYTSRQNIALIEEILVGQTPIRFNRHVNKLFVDTNWSKRAVGDYILIDAYMKVDPADYPDVWKDRWLNRYTTELIREQWGNNLTKFTGMQLPGGVQFNGEAILSQARENLKALEDEMISSYSLPVCDFTG